MKKLLSLLLLVFFLVSSLNFGTIYANEVSALDTAKEKSIDVLEYVEKVADSTVTKIDAKTNDKEIEQRLEEKQEEIKEYLEEAKEKIEDESSKGDIKEIVEEAKKVVVLKVVSAVTEYEDIGDNIPKELAKSEASKEHAIDVVQNSLESNGNYKLIIKTKFDKEKVEKTLGIFDEKLKVNFMYESDGDNYFELSISNDSIFRKEMLEDIDSGNIPETFLGIEIVKPEVFGISEINNSEFLNGENTDITRGIKMYKTPTYLQKLKESGKTIKVGVVDTGIDYNHNDLKGKVVLGYDFVNNDNDAMDDQGHGTHVSGTIAASVNGVGIVGVNPYVQLVPLKICDSKGFCPSYAVIRALEYAKDKKIDVLNMSLGGRGDPKTSPICDGIDSVVKSGIIVIAASGNSNVDTSTFVPGGCNESITVAAVDENLTRASFSNYGNKVNVSAPGVGVYSTYPGNNYKVLNGTSMATPHIVGLVSVMKSFKGELTKNDILALLSENSIKTKFESNKYIPYFPNVEEIVSSLTYVEEVIKEEEKIVEISEEKVEEIITKDEAVIDNNLIFVENQEDIDKKNQVIEDEGVYESSVTTMSNIQMDFGDKNTSLNINSADLSTSLEIVDIAEPVVSAKPYSNSPSLQSFDASGNSVKINSADETEEKIDEGEEIVGGGEELDSELDLDNLPINDEGIDEALEENVVETEEVEAPQERMVINLEGGSDSVKINSAGEGEIEVPIDENFTDIELKEYKENNIIDENGNVIEDIDLSEFQEDEEKDGINSEEGVEINSVGEDENFENFGYSENGAIMETPDDLGNLLEENMGIQNASGPLKVSSVSHTFGNLLDNQIYDGYIGYGSYKFPMNYSQRGSIGTNYIEAKTIDNYFSLFTKDRFEYKKYTNPKKFIGKFKTTFPTSYVGRGQYGYIGISNSDENNTILSLGITTYQYNSIRYSKRLRTGNYICSTNSSWDEVECFNNNFEQGRYLQLVYKKENGKYSVVNYKLPDYLYGEYLVDFSVDFETKKINAKIFDINGNLKENLNISFSKLSDFKNIDFSDFKYVVRSGVTNNSNQKVSPIELAIDFGEVQSSIKLLDLKTQQGSINLDNQYSFDINIKGFSNVIDANILDYYYSFNGVNYKKYDNQININTASGETNISQDINKSMVIDISNEKDGDVNIFAKALSGALESNVMKVKLLKDTNPLEAPSDIITKDIMYNKVTYNWKDNSSGLYDEKKFIIKDENGKIIVDNIPANTTSYTESSLNGSTTYKRMICSVLDSFESCTNLIIYSTPITPSIRGYSFYESLSVMTLVRGYNLSFSTEGIVGIKYFRKNIVLEGLKAGYVEVYVKDSYGRITNIIQVTVIAKPKPIEYNVELPIGVQNYIYLPEDISNYDFEQTSSDKRSILSQLKVNKNSFFVETKGGGEVLLHLKERSGYRFDKYLIRLTIKPAEEYITLNVSDVVPISFHSDYYRYVEDNSLIDIRVGSKKRVVGLKPGKTRVFIYDKRNDSLLKIIYITVNPIPKPKEIDVITEVGKKLEHRGNMDNGYFFTESKRGMLSFRLYGNVVKFDAVATGTAKVYIKSPIGNYITHIYNVTVNPIPVVLYNCETPLGIRCESYRYGTSEGYTYQVSKAGIVDLSVGRYFYTGTTKKYEVLHVKGIKEGEVDVYVYKLGDHVATIKTKVLPPISRINLEKNSIKIKEGKTEVIKIIAGGGEYIRGTYDKNIIDFTVRQDSSEVKISGKLPGVTYPTIKDKYGQETDIKVTVLDSALRLDKYDIEVRAGFDLGYIGIEDYYVGIKQLKKSNENVKVRIYDYKDNLGQERKQLRIDGKYTGETILELEDYEGYKRSVRVTVVGGGSGNNGSSGGNNSGGNEQLVTPEDEAKAMQEIDKQLEDLFKELGIDGVEINGAYDSNAGCTINTQDKCVDNALELTAKEKKIYILNKITPKIDDIVEKMFAKFGKRGAEVIIKSLQTDYSNVSNNHKIAIEALVVGFKLRLSNEEYREGMQDALSLNNLYDIAIEIGAGYAIGELAKKTSEILIKKYGEKVAIKFGVKAIPIAGWGLAGYAIATAGTENITYLSNCYGNVNVDGKSPSYYCGALTANGLLILGGIGVSHANPKGWFKLSNKIESKFDKSKIDFIKNRMEQMDSDILKKNIDNPDAFVKSFEDGRYPNLKKIDVDGKAVGISFNGEKFKDTRGYTVSGDYDFIITTDKKIIFGLNHSYLSVGKNVEYAGGVHFSNKGIISEINNASGHYKPNFNDINIVIELLKSMGVDTSNINLVKKF